ncbi:MAG: hypothetical protein JJE09_15580 [Bacteroidia bacterium]|nr:hypothetical protein [Bacteroidia bacterium]
MSWLKKSRETTNQVSTVCIGTCVIKEYEFPKLKTLPKGKDWVKLDEKGERTMFIYDLDIGPGMTPPMTPPGIYTIVLKANGKEYRQLLSLDKDPNTKGTEADILRQHDFGMKLYSSTSTTLQLIGDMETMRAKLLTRRGDKKAILLEDKIYQLEAGLHDIHQTGARFDIFRNPPQILERLLAMAKEGQISSADAPPTDQQQEVYEVTNNKLEEIKISFENLKKTADLKSLK